MAHGGPRSCTRPMRRGLSLFATAIVAGLALPGAAGAACSASMPAEGVTTPALGCEVTAGFHVVSPTGTPVRVDPGGTLQVNALPESTATAPQTLVAFAWDWGSGTFGADDPSSAATHVFPTRGAFDVRVRATDSTTPTPNVQASGPTHVFVAYPLSGSFTATPTGHARTFDFGASASETGAASITYRWDFNGDGTYDTPASTTPSVQYTYPSDGDYTPKLLITDDLGQTVVASLSSPVHAFNQAPTLTSASVSPNPAGVGTPVTLSVAATDSDGTIVSYLFDIDGNGSPDQIVAAGGGGGASYVVSYPNAGTIPVRVGAQDDSGGITWTTIPLTVNLPGGGNGTIDGGGALGPGAPGTATGPGAGGGAGGSGGVGFSASLGGSALQKLKLVRTRGLSFTCAASHSASCSVSVWLAAKDARALRINRRAKRPVAVGAFRADVAAGKSVTFTLRTSGKLKRALARTRRLTLTIRGVASEKGSTRTVSLARTILLRR